MTKNETTELFKYTGYNYGDFASRFNLYVGYCWEIEEALNYTLDCSRNFSDIVEHQPYAIVNQNLWVQYFEPKHFKDNGTFPYKNFYYKDGIPRE